MKPRTRVLIQALEHLARGGHYLTYDKQHLPMMTEFSCVAIAHAERKLRTFDTNAVSFYQQWILNSEPNHAYIDRWWKEAITTPRNQRERATAIALAAALSEVED